MAIDALYDRPLEVIPEFNVTDDIGANVEAMRLSGLVDDANREATLQAVADDFNNLDFNNLGRLDVAGELFVAIPQLQLPLSHRIDVLDGATKAKYGKDHPKPYVDESLWVPGTKNYSYTDEMLGRLGPEFDGKQWAAHGRLVIPNPDNPKEPMLHHLNKPFDGKYASKGQETQLEAIARQKADFEAVRPEANLNPLTARDISFIALVRLVKGESMPMEWGFMRDATLPRVDGDSVVGRVNSDGSQLKLDRSRGDADPSFGGGVSAGLNPVELQAS